MIDELRRRLLATRWPKKETVADRSQGAQLGKIQGLVRYWATDYHWRDTAMNYPVGAPVPIRYDPNRPGDSILVTPST